MNLFGKPGHKLREGKQLAKVTGPVGPFPPEDSVQLTSLSLLGSLNSCHLSLPCAALLTRPCQLWPPGPSSSAEAPLRLCGICSPTSPAAALWASPTSPLSRSLQALCTYLTLVLFPDSFRVKSMTHSSSGVGVGDGGQPVGVLDTLGDWNSHSQSAGFGWRGMAGSRPCPGFPPTPVSIEPVTALRAHVPNGEQGQPIEEQGLPLTDRLLCSLFPAGPGPVYILPRLDPAPTPLETGTHWLP